MEQQQCKLPGYFLYFWLVNVSFMCKTRHQEVVKDILVVQSVKVFSAFISQQRNVNWVFYCHASTTLPSWVLCVCLLFYLIMIAIVAYEASVHLILHDQATLWCTSPTSWKRFHSPKDPDMLPLRGWTTTLLWKFYAHSKPLWTCPSLITHLDFY